MHDHPPAGDPPADLKPADGEDAQISRDHQAEHQRSPEDGPGDEVVQRWHDLREMLIRQLDQFETGGLTLRANDVDVSADAITDLKRSILEFDALISQAATGGKAR